MTFSTSHNDNKIVFPPPTYEVGTALSSSWRTSDYRPLSCISNTNATVKIHISYSNLPFPELQSQESRHCSWHGLCCLPWVSVLAKLKNFIEFKRGLHDSKSTSFQILKPRNIADFYEGRFRSADLVLSFTEWRILPWMTYHRWSPAVAKKKKKNKKKTLPPKKKKKPKQNAPAYAKMFLSSPTSHPGSRFLTPVREGVCNVCSIEVNLSSRKQNDREAADIPVPYHMWYIFLYDYTVHMSEDSLPDYSKKRNGFRPVYLLLSLSIKMYRL